MAVTITDDEARQYADAIAGLGGELTGSNATHYLGMAESLRRRIPPAEPTDLAVRLIDISGNIWVRGGSSVNDRWNNISSDPARPLMPLDWAELVRRHGPLRDQHNKVDYTTPADPREDL